MKSIFFILLSFALTNVLNAQSHCACCMESHKQFDFWEGDWNVLDTLLQTAFLGIYHRKKLHHN
jgi:hypothetical protein